MNHNEDDATFKLLTVISAMIERNGGSLEISEDELEKHTKRILSGDVHGILAERSGEKWIVREASERDHKLAVAAMLRELMGMPPREGATEAQEQAVEKPVPQEFTLEDEKTLRGMGFKL